MESLIENAAKKAYSEILELIKTHKDICLFDIDDLERKSSYHLFGIKLKETYGFNVEPKSITSLGWIKLQDHIHIAKFGKNTGRPISWSDNGKQPMDELLMLINFPTGAYIFGEDYPTVIFEEFFKELKTYGPKYADTQNNGLYFSMDNAGIIFNEYKNIFQRYKEMYRGGAKQRQIEKLKEDLEKLQNSK